jgi:uncharacterized BrkB/YihY/UPF0761 family membrane protein
VARTGRAVIVLLLLFSISLLLSLGIQHLRRTSAIGGLAAIVGFTLIPAGMWLALEYAMPHSPGASWKDLLPGAVLFGVAVVGLDLFSSYWFPHIVVRRSATYGAIGVSLALLLWAYVFGRIMTASAVLNAALWARAHARVASSEPDGPAHAADGAATDLDGDEGARREPGPEPAT